MKNPEKLTKKPANLTGGALNDWQKRELFEFSEVKQTVIDGHADGIGFAPMVVKVLTLFSVVAILWNEWDEYEVRRENDDLYKYSENVGTNARSKEY